MLLGLEFYVVFEILVFVGDVLILVCGKRESTIKMGGKEMTKKLKKQIGRVISLALSVAMLVTGMPADLLAGVASVKAAEPMVLNASSLDAATLTEAFTADGFTINATSDKSVVIEANKKTLGDVNYTQRIKFGGNGEKTYRNIQFATTGAADIEVVAESGKSGTARPLVLSDGTATIDTKNFDAIAKETYSVTEAGTYYLWCTNNSVCVFSVTVTPKESSGAGSGEEGTGDKGTGEEGTGDKGTGDVEEEEGTAIAYTASYNFADGSVIPQDTTVATKPFTTKDGLVTLGTGYQYHDASHGTLFNGTTITIKAKKGYVVNRIILGTCQYSAETGSAITLKADDEVIQTVASAKTEKCSDTFEFLYDGTEREVVLEFGASTTYVPTMVVYASKPVSDAVVDRTKIDAWDFGAGELDATKYNNLLTADIINGFYPGVAAGTIGKNIASFNTGDLFFEDGGYSATHRWRTKNTALTCYDNSNYPATEGFTGYIYSNKSATDGVYLALANVQEGDIITVYGFANSTTANFVFECLTNPNVEKQVVVSDVKEKDVKEMKFYAPVTGNYKIYCDNAKLEVARITRQHPAIITVSGTAEIPATLEGPTTLQFTDQSIGTVKEAVVGADGSYSVELYADYDYVVSLKDVTDHVIKSGAAIDLNGKTEAVSNDIVVEKVAMKTMSGTITGLDAETLATAEFAFETENVYKPQIKINAEASPVTYTIDLEVGADYKLVLKNINDYQFKEAVKTDINITEDTADVELAVEMKPVHAITLAPEGATLEALKDATVTFANLGVAGKGIAGDEGYTYTFTIGTDDIKLRDGVYSVKFANTGIYRQELTSNLKVDGADVTKTVKFSSDPVTKWVFNAEDWIASGITTSSIGTYNTLKVSNSKPHNNVYCYSGAGAEIQIPVPAGTQKVVVNFCYSGTFTFDEDTTEYTATESKGSTGSSDTVTYTVTNAAASVVTMKVSKEIYINYIEVIEDAEYKEVVTVNPDGSGDYTTIADAIAGIKKMPRTAGQVVTVKIAPGNYEEMIVIDTPDVKLVNASATPSIALKNKGVDIDENAVRITSYYGHGYSYYSMGADCKWNADVLAANKENGYESKKNPGGTTDGCYWNATVVISANNVSAEGIIFENSFNQYVSAKAADDVIVPQGSAAKELASAPRASLKTVGDTTVQKKEYVERACALAMTNNVQKIYFENCKFVGRQDILYGGTGALAAFQKCSLYGGTDYIMGPMTAAFNECDLVLNTDPSNSNDVAHITAAQTKNGYNGMVFYKCNVTSTTPGVDTASTAVANPGTFGRNWEATHGQAVFVMTTVGIAGDGESSLIQPAGWNAGLSGGSKRSYDYRTRELAPVDNTAKRDTTAFGEIPTTPIIRTAKVENGVTTYEESPLNFEAFLGEWKPFGADYEMDFSVVDPVRAAAPVATPEAGSYKGETTVKLASATEGATIYYTLDGKAPTVESNVYDDATGIVLACVEGEKTTYVVKAIAVADGYDMSLLLNAAYEIDGKKEVDPSKLITKKGSIDVKNGAVALDEVALEVGKVYGDDLLKLEVLEDMKLKDATQTVTIDGKEYTGCVQGTTNGTNAFEIPVAKAAFKFTPSMDMSLELVCKAAAKTYYFVDSVDGNVLLDSSFKNTAIPAILKFDLKAGHVYYYYATGSKAMLYAVNYSYQVESNYKISEFFDATLKAKLEDEAVANDTVIGAAETVYGSDTSLATYEVLDASGFKKKAGTSCDGVDYAHGVQLITNPVVGADKIPTGGAAIKVTVKQDGKLVIAAKGTGSATKYLHFVDTLDGAYQSATSKEDNALQNSEKHTFDVQAGHVYYLYVNGSKIYPLNLYVESGDKPRAAWDTVADPVIDAAKIESADGKIKVPVTVVIGADGADKVAVDMFDAEGTKVDTKLAAVEGTSATLTFEPEKSGNYTFVATASRDDEDTKKVTEATAPVAFVYPLAVPAGLELASLGGGKVSATWKAVKEATGYEVTYYVKDNKPETITENTATSGVVTVTELEATLEGLEVGSEFVVEVRALRAGADSAVEKGEAASAEVVATANAVEKDTWEIDLSEGLKAGTMYADGLLWVLSDMELKKSDAGVPYVKGSVNPKKAGATPAGTAPDTGTVVVVQTPEDDGKVNRFTIKSKASGKKFYLVSVDSEGNEEQVDAYDGGSDPIAKKYVLDPNKTYYFYASGSNQEIYAITVERKIIQRGDWAAVEAPVIESVEVGGDKNEKIVVSAKGLVGDEGADVIKVGMYDAKGDLVTTKESLDDSDGTTATAFEFVPTASGTYTFIARLEREGEVAKTSERTEGLAFKYPLATPSIASVTNKGLAEEGKNDSAKLEVIWYKVNETRKYKLQVTKVVEGETKVVAEGETTGLEYTFEDLTVGDQVKVSVIATRDSDEDASEAGTYDIEITGANDKTWIGASFGSNASTKETATVNADGTITIDANSNTKIVPGSTDGLMYYYTKLDANDNFVLTAKVKGISYKPDNGQEGFGIMAADAVGEHGNGAAFWNNSYQIVASQIQYNWDPTIKDENGKYVGGVTTLVSDSETVFQNKMRLGIGWTLKQGVTLVDKQKIANGELTAPTGWSSGTQGTLETSVSTAIMEALYKEGLITDNSTPEEVQAAYKNYKVFRGDVGAEGVASASFGQFNIIGNNNKAVSDTVKKIGDKEFTPVTEMIMQIQRNNTGYILRYALAENAEEGYEGEVITLNGKDHKVVGKKVLYDDNRNTLSQIDKKNIYVGFFAARVTKMTVEEFEINVTDPENDPPAEEKILEEVPLQVRVLSAETSNSKDYSLVMTANADGKLTVVNKTTGKAVVSDFAITSGKRITIGTKLATGMNELEYVFKANQDYVPGENKKLASFEAVGTHLVSYEAIGGDIIYVAPNGTGDGLDETTPTDIYTAVAYAQPGQKIYLAGERYYLGTANDGANANIRIERGNDGTEGNMIYLQTNPKDVAEGKRAILDFKGVEKSASGITLVASYWYLKDFDVTNSKNVQDGILVAGKYNVLDNLRTYENGNTGIQIARDGSDGRALWPAYNLILNCTSYLNYDEGYQDADGFAAKLTVGDGNKFMGCVAAYNADDGWDLFSKVQTGNIGVVTIDSSVAYKNGLLLGTDKTSTAAAVIDYAGAEFEAGNGNGFKMGGDGLSGKHILKNSVSFGNMANGIDSNSCPDIKVYDCISYKNVCNIGLTSYESSVNTDYTVSNVLSVAGKSKDKFEIRGTQVRSKVYNATNYFCDGTKSYNAADDTKVLPNAADIFVSVDPKDAGVDPAHGSFIARTADGSINLGNFLKLKDSFAEEYGQLGGAPEATNPEVVTKGSEEVAVFANAVTYLSDVKVPETLDGYKWKYPETLTAPFAGVSADFVVVDGDGNEETVTVDFVEITGVVATADEDGLFGDGTITVTAQPTYAPANLPVDLNDIAGGTFTFTFADKSKLGLAETAVDGTEGLKNAVELSRSAASKEGIAKYVATMQFTAGKKAVKATSAVVAFETRKEQYEFSFDAVEAEGISASVDGVRFANAGLAVKLENLKVTGVANEAVKVTVGDSKVAKLDAKTNTLTAVAAGTTYLALTAAADKNVVVYVPVVVEGTAYTTNVATITVDRAKTTGATFQVIELTSALSGDVTVKKVIKGAKTTLKGNEADTGDGKSLKIENTIGDFYTITVVDEDEEGHAIDMIKAGTYTVVLADEEGVEFEPVVLKVVETKPVVSFKQTKKVNLYYNAGTNPNTGYVTASSKLAGVDVIQKNVDTDDYKLVESGKGYNVVLKASAANRYAKGGKLNNKIAVTVSFDGYKAAYNKDAFVNVSTVTQAPKYVLEIDNKTFYPELAIDSTEIRIFNQTTGTYVTDADVTLASSTPAYVKANANFFLDENAGTYTLTTTKAGTAKISVIDPEFGMNKKGTVNEVILSAPIAINKGKTTVTVGKIALSAQPEFVGVEAASAVVTVRNALDYTVRDDVELVGKSAKAAALLPYLNVEADKDEKGQAVLLVSFQDSDEKTMEEAIAAGIIKAGSYAYTATFTVNDLKVNTNVNVAVKAAATATSSVKGSLDILNRAGSKLTVKGTVKNLNGTVVGMRLGDDKMISKNYKAEFGASDLFNVEWDSTKGAAIVTLKDTASYRVNGKYKVTPIYTVATPYGEVEVTAKPITITTKQAAVKFTAVPVIEAKLSVAELGVPATANMAVKSANVEIESLQQLDNLKNFEVEYDVESGNLDVYVINNAGLKAGKTYTIKLGVNAVGAGSGLKKQQVVTVKVKVLN